MAFSFGSQSSSAQGGFSFGASSGSLFGNAGAASAPAFGASSASFNPFGNQASQSNLFGSTTSGIPNIFSKAVASGSSSGFSFGASSGGLFGSSQAASGSLFGAAQPASSASLFGSTQTFGGFGAQTPSTPNLFGQQPAQQNQLIPAGYASGIPGQPDFSALREIEAIAAAYDPASPKYRFNYLFLNVVDNPASRLKPNDVDEIQWRGAVQRAGGLDNPDRLWPVQAKGFKDLLARKQAQDQAIKEYAERLDAAEQSAKRLQRRQQALLKERIDMVQRKHAELSHRLLTICRHIDALEGRLALAQDYWSSKPAETVNKLSEMLRVVEQTMQYHSAGGLQKKVEALAATARLKADAPVVQSELPGIDEESLKQVFGIVSQQAAAIERLQGVIKRSSRDLAIMESEERALAVQ